MRKMTLRILLLVGVGSLIASPILPEGILGLLAADAPTPGSKGARCR